MSGRRSHASVICSLFTQQNTKQWMSSGWHWVFRRFAHERWIYDEFSSRWRYTQKHIFI